MTTCIVEAICCSMCTVFCCLYVGKNAKDDYNLVHPYDDIAPRKMTYEELDMYNLHINMYGTHGKLLN